MLMYRYVFGRREDRGRRRRWPRSRAGGCLMLILLVIVVLVILSVMFGGFQKGTKANGGLNGIYPAGASTVTVTALLA
jgi:ABC-type Fe3+ transport system permease subunit